MLYKLFGKGINIGGWLSQWNCVPVPPVEEEEMKKHFQEFITEENIKQIAGWGMDHVRLPVDYRIFEKSPSSLEFNREGFYFIDLCADWCQKYGLNLILDLHDMEGNVYGAMESPMPLLTEEGLKKKFCRIWEEITLHFLGRKAPVIMFELLNEVSDGSGYLWNELCRQAVKVIRNIDKDRYILIGSNEQNSAFRLKELQLWEDDKVFYNFHFYDPQAFTHQRAHFSEEMLLYNKEIHYPGEITGFTDFLLSNRKYIPKYARVCMEDRVDKESMRRLLKDAFDFVKYTDRELYCGEFGVITAARPQDAAAWLKDVMELLDEQRIGHAIWNYKELDFGFVNMENETVSNLIIKELFDK